MHRDEHLLNTGDTPGIQALSAPDGIADWNDQPTFSTPQEARNGYDALFRIAETHRCMEENRAGGKIVVLP